MSDVNTRVNNQGLKVEIGQSTVRQTPRTDFGHVLAVGAQKGINVVATAAGIAAPAIPGAAAVGAAIHGVGQAKSALVQGQGVNSNTLQPAGVNFTGTPTGGGNIVGATGGFGGMGGIGGGAGGGAFDQVNTLAASGDPQAQMFNATKQLQELNQSFNLQYLMLQQDMQSENRRWTTLSNVMKTKHDTAKNAINNVR